MCDPITALSISAAAIQFVDFSCKIVCKGREIYSSVDGALRENRDAETVTIRLKQMTQALGTSATQGSPSNAISDEVQKQQAVLQAICDECRVISTELLKRLQQLRVPSGSAYRGWKSFRQALKSVWSKSEIDSMASRLVLLRGELNTHIVVVLKYNFDATSIDNDNRFLQLNTTTRAILRSITETGNAQSQEMKQHFSRLTEWQRQQFKEMRAYFVQADCNKRKSRIELDILESLRFQEIQHRYEEIRPAHAKTFTWIFRDPQECHKPWDNFVRWLRCDSGVYWMQGKAASGKSTLMRFLWDHPTTHDALKLWADGARQLITGSFFFWNSGIQEQRSQVGLFRTLMYGVLNQYLSFISAVFPEEWERKSKLAANDMKITSEIWSLGRLQSAFDTLIGLCNHDLRLCFFIDGLDEYEGKPAAIAEYIDSASRSSAYVKFCASSRPWPVFQDIFRESPGLRLQDLTKEDIKVYVSDILEKNRHMQNLLKLDPAGTVGLIDEIVDKAEGVFLWVTLVVKSLINGLRDGDGITHLQHRLASLPSDLEKFYGHMPNGIEPEYQEESSKIFQIFRESRN